MKVLWFLAIFAVAVTSSPIEQRAQINGENGWYVPQQDGSLKWMSTEAAEKKLAELEAIEELGLSTHPVSFYLYTKSNPTKAVKLTEKTIAASNFNAAHPTRFVIHGWTQSYTSSMNKEIRDAWLSRGDFNVIVVDWMRARSVEYASSVVAIPTVGKKVAAMVDLLHNNHGMPLHNLYVIGHSLGAHVAGQTGKKVKSGQINTIIGLDPAMPLFSYTNTNKRFASTDGYYVEAIHTNGGELGFLKPVGKSDFYPNGGTSQPGCFMDLTGSCAHARSVSYYAESVEQNNFPSVKCGSYQDASKNSCGSTYSSIRMGNDNNKYAANGEFYVPVNSKSPFGMG